MPTLLERDCRHCGRPFQFSIAYRNTRHFCSRSCVARHRGKPLAVRFRRYVGVPDEGGCLVWTGTLDRKGYGVIHSDGGGNLLAHRAAWELARGPIPDGLCVLHRCDNPPCVNVEHLFLGTHADNAADKVAKGRQNRGADRWNAKLDAAKVGEIRRLYAGGTASLAVIARRFGVAKKTIHDVVQRRVWAHVE